MTESTGQMGRAQAQEPSRSSSNEFVEIPGAESLGDGEMTGVEIDGERVLLAKVSGEFYAIGGICSHERANLDEGSLCEHVVYCPLHYSAFDVRSGQVLGPPADRPTPRYRVKLEDDRVLVSAKPGDGQAGGSAPPAPAEAGSVEPLERARPWYSKISSAIDSLAWLQRLSDRAMSVLAPWRARLARTGVLDLLHGRWFGHSLHPALSDLPIGLWASSLLLYVIGESRPAAILGLAGTISAVGTAVTGVVDWSVTDGHERRAGLLHGVLMTGALLVQAGSTVAYYAVGALPVAVGLSAAGLMITIGAAYFGGHLVFDRGTMVNHTSWPPGPAQWVATVSEAELDGAPKRSLAVDVGDKKVLLHRNHDGRITAIHNSCSHAGGPLSLGTVCDGVVTCPWHDSKFRLRDGTVLRGPAIYPQPVFEVRVQDGRIEIRASR
ncbi:MAG: Rieske 2Fe-2S domain-containing protein [Pseudonocardia sp.]|nr:Rieske 2Fe-2S domain-containing protein [Pseudonocardia sp.]